MSLGEDLAAWVNSRHDWQKLAVSRLCKNETLNAADLSEIADHLIAGSHPVAPDIAPSDIPGSTAGGDAVTLTEISEIAGINALVSGQTLSFSLDGLTIVFGNNASGKSGYARLIREAVNARVKSGQLLGDVFAENVVTQSANIAYAVGTTPTVWRLGVPPRLSLSRIRFYDEDCGDAYVSKAAEVDYQPSGLMILDQLSAACEELSAEFATRLAANETARPALPILHDDSTASRFLKSIDANTSISAVDAALTLEVDHDSQLAKALTEEARLKGSDPGNERTRLTQLSQEWSTVGTHAKKISDAMGQESFGDLKARRSNAEQLREAARIASSSSFDSEPLSNVGSETWRALWEAARAFSQADAYHDHDFPYTGESAVCVLCQQPLTEQAADRLTRFETFVSDTTSRDADTALASVQKTTAQLGELQNLPTEVSTALGKLQEAGEDVTTATQWFEAATTTATGAVDWLADASGVKAEPQPIVDDISMSAVDRAKQLSGLAADIDSTTFDENLAVVSQKVVELQDLKALAEAQEGILAEISRLKQRRRIEEAKSLAATNSITTKRGELTERYVTQEVRDHFTREAERLGLRRVTLNRTGRGREQALMHQPGLVGSQQKAAVEHVLSEGEQTALGLAGFLTEVELDASRSGVVLDDPVSSLDSERRTRVAQRLIELAQTRQVIIFTHEITFVQALIREAERSTVPVEKRSVQRKGETQPGHILEELPWAAKDIPQRINGLEAELNSIRKTREELTDEQYADRIALLAGRLSETLERAVNLHVVNELVDRGRNEVRPVMLKILPKFTQVDHDEYQAAYAKTSSWAARHDNAPEENYVPPEVDEVAAELSWLRTWHGRVKKYAS